MKKPQATMKLSKVVSTKLYTPKKIESKKVKSLEDAYIKSAGSSLSRYGKTGSQSDLSSALGSGKSGMMLDKKSVEKIGVKKTNKMMVKPKK